MLLTVREYAEKYGLPKMTVNTAIKRGKIIPAKQSKGKFWIEDKKYDFRATGHRNITADPAYTVWQNVKKRCENPNATQYKWYGGKGVKLCEEWHNSTVFIDWLYDNGWRPNMKLSIDRINSDGDYCPENCRIIPMSLNTSLATLKHKP